jgi:two-component system response regulator RegA
MNNSLDSVKIGSPEASDQQSGPVILLVDDDCVFAERLAKAFRDRGFHTEIQNSVDTAIDAIRSRHFDVVITDLRIGNRSGLEIVEEAHATAFETKTLVLTGYGNVQAAVAAVKLGASEFLCKPADADEILEVLGVPGGPLPHGSNTFKPADLVRLEHITTVFAETGNNVSATARILNMHRRTLQRLLARWRRRT